MTTLYLPGAQTIDAIAYPGGCVLEADRATAASLVAAGSALYATGAILGACGQVPRYDHTALMDMRRVSGRTGAGPTDTPATCTLPPSSATSYVIKAVTIDGQAYTAGQVITTSIPTARDLVANGFASTSPAQVTAGIAISKTTVNHAAAVARARR